MTQSNWRTPLAVLICGGIILTLSLGTRHSFGLYLQPMTLDLGWNRQTFAIAIAIQNLVFGLATPFAGMITDKYGAARVLVGGTIFYAIGLALMAYTKSGPDFILSAGLLVGIGVSCSGFSIVFGVVGRAFPPEKRTMALGIAGAAGSFGQFVMLPFGQALINQIGWHNALLILAVTVMLIVPLSVYLFGATIGFLWLGTVPVTCGLIAHIFGVKYLSTLTGIAFLFHQVGSFLGIWIGGYLFDTTGSYKLMWLLTIAMGVAAALINLPIDERQIVRPAMKPA